MCTSELPLPGPGIGLQSRLPQLLMLTQALPPRLLPPPPSVHSYKSMLPEMDRVMEFYKMIRVDGLVKREETPMTMTEYYQGRSDFLSYRHINFGPRVKKLTQNSADSNPRPVVVRIHLGLGDRLPTGSGKEGVIRIREALTLAWLLMPVILPGF